MEAKDIFTLVAFMLTFFGGIIFMMVKNKNSTSVYNEKEHNKTIDEKIKTVFKKVDENRKGIDSLKDKLNKEYHDKIEIREYIELSQRTLLSKIDHMEKGISEMKEMLEKALSKKVEM